MNDTSPVVANLQSQWHTLTDLDRARAVSAIQRSGIQTREIAFHLNCSESLLRHLLTALQAPPEDRYLGRRGKISTNELARRTRAAGTRRAAKHREAREFERTQAALQGCKTICDWLQSEGLSNSDGGQIVDEAQRQLANTELTSTFPKVTTQPDMPTGQIIQSCQPTGANFSGLSSIVWFGTWLAIWSYYSMTDPRVRSQAIDLALNEQIKR
jgi:hypothetical protein